MSYGAVHVGWIYLVHENKLIENGLLVWKDKIIEYIGDFDQTKIPRGTDVYHISKGILLPPFINGHTHIPETLIRGLIDDVTLGTWLYDHVWQVEPKMTAADAIIGTKLGIAEMLASGSIGFIDQFYYSTQISEAVIETGVKAFLFPSIFDNNPESGSVENSINVAKNVFNKWDMAVDRIRIGYGPHALYSVAQDLFSEIGHLAREQNTMIHTHVSETKTERKNAIENWGHSTVKELEKIGILDTIAAAHAVHVDDEDIALFGKRGVSVLHNIQSNMKLGSGLAPVPKFVDNDINVLIGTDGNASNNNLDMLEEIRTVSLVHKGFHHDPKLLPMNEVLKMATTNAGKLMGDMYSGKLEHGEFADFTIFNLDHISSTPIIRPESNLVYSVNSTSCVMTVANGDILFHDGEYSTLDIETIKQEAQKSINRMISDAKYEP